MEFLKEERIRTMEWPPYSPDLSPIENLWGIISQKVYHGGKAYQTADELWEAVQREWDQISAPVLQNLYCSLLCCCVDILKSGGRRIQH